ncbi:MAG: transcriptional repressor LexA [Verrucomicrobia bacterium]|nr:transcriptional repressor LexA [Verrucomicrobiota bacterium]MBU4291889.1 transcriptional repressor LexA [Verrucomicrobiota bacterium]MBU4429810.1 transcriptional repressor LexA [Verrucomicrobiota bacterium]MCG2680283.1 transcriptional repressor LexA [Kiritimatiellia bacterium]
MPRILDLQMKIRSLRRFVKTEGRIPTYREMLALFEYRSKNAVHGLVKKLVHFGYVRKSRGKLAATSRLTGVLKLLGAVQAGFPSPAEEELADTINLDEFLVERPDTTYLLTVSGDSMIEAGIHPGDLVLVEKGRTPKNRDIVVAQVDDEWTIKYFIKDSEGILLQPANRKYESIRPRRFLTIGGVVRAVIRKL